MAISVFNAGPALIKINDFQGGGIQSLGYTRNGADTTKEAFFVDVPGDQNGGDEGPPIEIQYMGEIARVRLELTKWDGAVAALITCRVAGATDGTPSAAGTFMFAQSKFVRLIIDGSSAYTSLDINFPCAIPRMPIELNRGTKYGILVCEFECHKDASGVLHNTSMS